MANDQTQFIVTIRQPDGYEFNNLIVGVAAAREFMANATKVLSPGETVSYRIAD
jgi:hypothetical protein